jgi:hypothetical protein
MYCPSMGISTLNSKSTTTMGPLPHIIVFITCAITMTTLVLTQVLLLPLSCPLSFEIQTQLFDHCHPPLHCHHMCNNQVRGSFPLFNIVYWRGVTTVMAIITKEVLCGTSVAKFNLLATITKVLELLKPTRFNNKC